MIYAKIFKMKSYSMELKLKKQICYTKSVSNKAYFPFIWRLLKLMNHDI